MLLGVLDILFHVVQTLLHLCKRRDIFMRPNTSKQCGTGQGHATRGLSELQWCKFDYQFLNVTGFGKILRKGSTHDSRNALLVAQVKNCQSPNFVIHMSNNPSNCCHRLRRLVVLYNGEISLHFDPTSRQSCRTRSPLLWALIRIPTSKLSRYS